MGLSLNKHWCYYVTDILFLEGNTWLPLKRKLTSAPSEVGVLITKRTGALFTSPGGGGCPFHLFPSSSESPPIHHFSRKHPQQKAQLRHPDQVRRNLHLPAPQSSWLSFLSQAELLLTTPTTIHNLKLPFELFVPACICLLVHKNTTPLQDTNFEAIA